ncbi:hypothetical protein PQX77_000846 [Marasmius sp. AFHP31]|nr:hypothetical protein PQX77_000846 [Marasmius sp. AFHP31]
MPRPKLYTTKSERRAANREKNKRFYDKNRIKIIASKKRKNVEQKIAQERQEIRERVRRREKRDRARRIGNQDEAPATPTTTYPTINIDKILEGQLEDLKAQYTARIQPGPRQFLDKLCEPCLQWRRSARGPIMTRTLEDSPVAEAGKALNCLVDEYESIAEEYIYSTRKHKGRDWDKKREETQAFKDAMLKLIGVLTDMHEMLNLEEYSPDLDDMRDLYIYNLQTREGLCAVNRIRVEIAKKRRSELEETEALRIKRRKEVDQDPDDYPSDEDLEAGWEKDMQWYQTYYKTLKISIQREVNNDVNQYFEKLYREFVQWKTARRSSVSPTVHPRAVFSSLMNTTETIAFKILSTVGYTALHRRYADLSSVASELYGCVRSLDDALEEEDAIDEDTVGQLRTVEERYIMRGYRFYGPALVRVYEQAGL